METEIVKQHANRLISLLEACEESTPAYLGVYAQCCEFLSQFAGQKSSFYNAGKRCQGGATWAIKSMISTLEGYIDYLDAGLAEGISPTRQAQLDVVSDLLEQAQGLLDTRGVHPAAPAVLVGATLEEFLRTWVEAEGLSLGNKKPGLDAYAKTLREAEMISKQDAKDITSWAGIRNHAAHGEWAEVSDKQRIALMLEGVNLFMRRYSE